MIKRKHYTKFKLLFQLHSQIVVALFYSASPRKSGRKIILKSSCTFANVNISLPFRWYCIIMVVVTRMENIWDHHATTKPASQVKRWIQIEEGNDTMPQCSTVFCLFSFWQNTLFTALSRIATVSVWSSWNWWNKHDVPLFMLHFISMVHGSSICSAVETRMLQYRQLKSICFRVR